MKVLFWIAAALAGEPIALVELFTSQGCSSCPPADALVATLDSEARKADTAVYVVSFHVDYWDRLGWKDPYSDARWTGRQKEYADTFRRKKLYTPQVVVNGQTQAVGSHDAEVRGLISDALAKPSTAKVQGKASVQGRSVRVEVTTTGAPIGGQIWIAVVEPQLENLIERGENRGAKGVHTNVVRAMVRAPAPGSSGSLKVPEDVDMSHIEVLAWVSDPLTMGVVGAAKLSL